MNKRGPQSELTDRNWDQEEEPEERGIFKQASKEAIQGRVIKKAKRRGAGDDSDGTKGGAFGGFGGFGGLQKSSTSSAGPPPILFGVKPDKGPPTFKLSSADSSSNTAAASSFNNSSTKSESENDSYLYALKALNESVLAWIKQHVEKSPYIILSPVFKDYEKHLAALQSKKPVNSNGNGSTSIGQSKLSPSSKSEEKTTAFSSQFVSGDNDKGKEKGESTEATVKPSFGFSFGASNSSNGSGFKFSSASTSVTAPTTSSSSFSFSSATSPNSGFSFGKSNTATTAAPSSGFSFGASTDSATKTTSSSFSGGAAASSGFSFGALAAKAMSEKQESSGNKPADDDDYVPPKPEVKEIKEEGSLYSKRCKLFYQKEGKWTERGVGNVHIKPMDNKTQLLVRADTNLGNVLLNINVTSGLPVSRQGKNNVLLVCVPNPPIKEGKEENSTTPIPMLVRVKTGEEADEMLTTLEERKALL